MEDPDGYSTKAYHFHCTQPPPLMGKHRFRTKIKLAQRRGRGEGYLQREGGKEGGRREGGREAYLQREGGRSIIYDI